MPQAPLTPCRMCNRATRGRYCQECKAKAATARDAGRKPSHARGYDRAHARRRAVYLHHYPLCAACNELATVLDHIIRIRDGGSASDWNNLQGLCEACHNRKSRLEQAGLYDAASDLAAARQRGKRN